MVEHFGIEIETEARFDASQKAEKWVGLERVVHVQIDRAALKPVRTRNDFLFGPKLCPCFGCKLTHHRSFVGAIGPMECSQEVGGFNIEAQRAQATLRFHIIPSRETLHRTEHGTDEQGSEQVEHLRVEK